MKALSVVLAVVVGSLVSVGCGPREEQDPAARGAMVSPIADVGAYCARHGGRLYCDLSGNCVCRYDAHRSGG